MQNQLNLHNDFQQHSPLKQQQGAHIKCPAASSAMSSDEADDDDSQGSPNKKVKASSRAINIKEEIDMDNSNHHNDSTSNNTISIKRRKSEDDHNSDSMDIKSEMSKNDGNLPRKKNAVRSQLAQQIIQSSSKQLKKPIYPVRPTGPSSSSPTMPSYNSHLALDIKILLLVFKHLSQETLVACSLVCKNWAQVRYMINNKFKSLTILSF